jgi:hypothetical protein
VRLLAENACGCRITEEGTEDDVHVWPCSVPHRAALAKSAVEIFGRYNIVVLEEPARADG